MSEKKKNNIPPKELKRNSYGLLEDQDYIFDENSLVNWRAMVPPKFLAPNKLRTTETDVSKIKDEDLIILLSGCQYLGNLYGFSAVRYKINLSGPEYISCICEIDFLPTYLTNGKAVTYSAVADAIPFTVGGVGKGYLASVAQNRAFSRCVRQFLQINIVSQEEISELPQKEVVETDPVYEKFASLMKEKDLDLEFIKEKLKDDNFQSEINSINDIPKFQVIKLHKKLLKFKKP